MYVVKIWTRQDPSPSYLSFADAPTPHQRHARRFSSLSSAAFTAARVEKELGGAKVVKVRPKQAGAAAKKEQRTIFEAIDALPDLHPHMMEAARSSMSEQEAHLLRARSPLALGELDWIASVVGSYPALARGGAAIAGQENVLDVVRIIVERVLHRTSMEAAQAIVAWRAAKRRWLQGQNPYEEKRLLSEVMVAENAMMRIGEKLSEGT